MLAVLRVLDRLHTPRGAERDAAVELRDWCARRWPGVAWQLLEHGAGASLVATHGGGPLVYSHLDTSLDGSTADRWVTGRDDPVGGLRMSGGAVDGFGLAVARGPAAAALVAFAGASTGSLLLAGSGTHRVGAASTGVHAYLAGRPSPPAAVVAKSGPRGVLWEEPGACYLTVQVRGRSGVVLAPASAVPSGGVAAQAGVVLRALGTWCSDYVAARAPAGQLGPAAGIGAIRSGWTDKPDLLPALLHLGLYAVTLPGEDVAALRADLEAHVSAALARSPLRDCVLDVSAEQVQPATTTDPEAPIVRAARRAWAGAFGSEPPPISGWTGSTDGAVFRAHGIDTVRLGPSPRRADDDPRRDVVDVAELAAFARVYRELLGGC